MQSGGLLLGLLGCFLLAVATPASGAGYPDLPSAASNLITVPAGSMVIAMGNDQLSGGYFNFKSYGLAVYLLYEKIPVYWVIKAGKAKDAADFTANAYKLGSATSSATSVSFAGGPFVIPQQFADQAYAIWQRNMTSVAVYNLTQATTVDVRHRLLFKPYALLSDIAGNADTQEPTLVNAGLVKGVHYAVAAKSTGVSEIVSSLNASSCFTLFSEPHYVWDSKGAPIYYRSVTDFVASGGNFHVQCASVSSYENYASGGSGGGAGFMSVNGVIIDIPPSDSSTLTFANPDVPYAQFIGSLDGDNSGHTPAWHLNTPSGVTQANDSQLFINNGFPVVHFTNANAGTGRRIYKSTAAKLTNSTTGGMVYFLASHSWQSTSKPLLINGQRMLMNAILTPADRPDHCGFNFCPEGLQCAAPSACTSCVCGPNNAQIITPIPDCCVVDGKGAPCPSPSPSATPSGTPSSTPSATPSVTPSNTATPSPVNATESGGLTPSETAGVAVGVVAGAVGVAAVAAAVVGAAYLAMRAMNQAPPAELLTSALEEGSAAESMENPMHQSATTEGVNPMFASL